MNMSKKLDIFRGKNMNNTAFGKNLCFIRKKRGLTQEQLAKKLNVSPQAVSKWEKSSYPDGELLPLLSRTLGVSLDVLFGLKNEDNTINLQQSITNEVRKTPDNLRSELVMNILYSALCAYNDYTSDSMKIPANLISETYAELKTDYELSIARLNDSLKYFCFLEIPENGVNSYVSINERILKLFKLLSDEDALKIIFHLAGGKRNYLITKECLTKRLNIPLKKVSEIIDTLDKMGAVWELTAEVNDTSQSVYGFAHSVPLTMILILAQSFVNYIQQREPGIEIWTKGAFVNNNNINDIKSDEIERN